MAIQTWILMSHNYFCFAVFIGQSELQSIFKNMCWKFKNRHSVALCLNLLQRTQFSIVFWLVKCLRTFPCSEATSWRCIILYPPNMVFNCQIYLIWLHYCAVFCHWLIYLWFFDAFLLRCKMSFWCSFACFFCLPILFPLTFTSSLHILFSLHCSVYFSRVRGKYYCHSSHLLLLNNKSNYVKVHT